MAEIEFVSYIPVTGSCKISYPKDFYCEEDGDGIVSIVSTLTYSGLTISGYQASLDVDEKVLTEFFQELTAGYSVVSEMSKEISTERLLIEQEFKKDATSWIWWAVAEENQIIMLSAHCGNKLPVDDYHLYKYMIDEMEIYPSSFDD